MLVLTIDQKGSRRTGDRVEELLARLADVPAVRPFERTVGDEVQAVVADASTAVRTALDVLRGGGWSVGIGAGGVEVLASSSRASSGRAFVHARDAVTAAKGRQRPVALAVRGDDPTAAEDAEAVLVLLGALRARRSDAGWQAVDALLTDGPGQDRVARRLGVTQQAVSQRLRAALWAEEQAALPTAARLLERAQGGTGHQDEGPGDAAGRG
ncbi:hypothetical protein [Cellulomonas marina]|uniref:SatD family (SatD) n=1 Tax=Cellulomonas marina TaxID=988821 RepID=A0A1I0W8U8_9CELL|nr:hypothetical protein [Cellulomonas marina]GIG29119.1 hypothetical protein Cma02nite_17190 [Cellulomonas marina]SFA84757.1 hypothetical protein SAMN05421867_102261 [Cellulomonas marina]